MTQEERFKRDEKITEMITSSDPEMVTLGMQSLKAVYPAVWSGLIGLSGLGEVTRDILATVANCPEVMIGSVVKYRGLHDSPVMVVTNAEITKQGTKIPSYMVFITAKFFNKSKQEFQTTKDRVEVFQLIEPSEHQKQKEKT